MEHFLLKEENILHGKYSKVRDSLNVEVQLLSVIRGQSALLPMVNDKKGNR